MTIFALVKLIHVASAIWLIAGLLGRWYALGASSHASDIRLTRAFADLAGRFENTMVIPGSIVVLTSGILTASLGGFPLLGGVQGGAWWLFVALLIFVGTIFLVPTVFLLRGRIFGAALDDATAKGEITPGLRAAFADTAVVRAHWLELVAVGVVLVLMVLKPF